MHEESLLSGILWLYITIKDILLCNERYYIDDVFVENSNQYFLSESRTLSWENCLLISFHAGLLDGSYKKTWRRKFSRANDLEIIHICICNAKVLPVCRGLIWCLLWCNSGTRFCYRFILLRYIIIQNCEGLEWKSMQGNSL